ncbi:PREDICTED: coiled-coil domain-containing protein 37-like [Cyprinodon variegatus]|uniref:coiled-coil domain-containing protein 37-like n=1 Tax=Cyprinodon variegatus TaxID=28743 RepID=UPI00074288EB|nr:PREDICTED: coiled-coil domain-containing protein 37-like [Cyprinodon variegatus]
MRRRTPQSPYKMLNSRTVFALSAEEPAERREEMQKFLALPIEEKATHAVRELAKKKNEVVGEVEEESGEKKSVKQTQTKTAGRKQTPSPHDQKISRMRGERFTKQSKYDLILMERQQAVLEISLMTKRSEIQRMDKVIAKEERKLKQFEKLMERDNQKFEEFLKENERRSIEARTLFEQEEKSKQEKNAAIRKLSAEMGTIQSELDKYEEALRDYQKYRDFLFGISPPEWQEEQKTKAQKTKALLMKDRQRIQNEEPSETGLESTPSSSGRNQSPVRVSRLPSAQSDSLETNCRQDCVSSEDEPELYFTDPQQLLDLMTKLTEQNLFLIKNSARVEDMLKEHRQTMETIRRQIEEEEQQIALQIKELNQRIHREKKRGAKLEQMIQLHLKLSSEDKDETLKALGEKVTDVHASCVGNGRTDLSTLEKLADIENFLSSLLQNLESLPAKQLAMVKKLKDSEKRNRMREEKLMEQREKQKERMRRYLERSLADSNKRRGKKLMPRYMPVVRRAEVPKVVEAAAEDDFSEFLSTSDDTE